MLSAPLWEDFFLPPALVSVLQGQEVMGNLTNSDGDIRNTYYSVEYYQGRM